MTVLNYSILGWGEGGLSWYVLTQEPLKKTPGFRADLINTAHQTSKARTCRTPGTEFGTVQPLWHMPPPYCSDLQARLLL